MSTEEVLAIIPARGGSMGIPHKNITPVGGKPLIAWTIENALNAGCVSRVVVSTDDDKISEISVSYGAETIRRPEEISGDTASSELALIHALDYLYQKEQYRPDWVAFLQCTSPLLTSDDIDAAFKIAVQERFDSVFSAYEQHFVGRWHRCNDGTVRAVNYEPSTRPMRQEVPLEYVENGALYLFRSKCLHEKGIRFGGRCGVHVMPAERSLQIDSLEDIVLIEKLLYDEGYKNNK